MGETSEKLGEENASAPERVDTIWNNRVTATEQAVILTQVREQHALQESVFSAGGNFHQVAAHLFASTLNRQENTHAIERTRMCIQTCRCVH